MKITRIKISNYLGVENLEANISPAGAVISGDNGRGKTTVLRAIQAALAAQGIGPEAIRLGADKAEILVDLDAVRVRRAITTAGSSLTVTTTEGDRWAKPQTRLTDLLGVSLDPLAFYLAKPAERRAQLLAAMPVEVTADDLLRWTGDDWQPTAGKHGLEVVAEVRAHYYTKRTQANSEAKRAQAEYAAAQDNARALDSPDHKGVVFPLPGEEETALRAAERVVEELNQRQRAADEMEKKTAGTRERIKALRSEVAAIEEAQGDPPALQEWERIEHDIDIKKSAVQDAKQKLLDAESALMVARATGIAWTKRSDDYNAADAKVGQLEQRAADLEATLSSTAVAPVSSEESVAARAVVAAQESHCAIVRAARAAHDAMATAAALGDEASAANVRADALDAVVQRLTNEAPAELAARSQMIPGVAFDGDAITLDGKPIDNLSGAEQMRLAVEIGKRANAKGKILVVDGMERLSAKNVEDFVRIATADGFQLLATRVTDGELVVEAIEAARAKEPGSEG